MKLIFLEWDSYGNDDILDAYQILEYTVIKFPLDTTKCRQNAIFEQSFEICIEEHMPDYVFSFNYYPVVSLVCNKTNIPYISWVYDSPYILLYSYTTINPCNRIFIFDRELYMEFHLAGINTVHYLPMAANTMRLRKTPPSPLSNDIIQLLPKSDISFIGSMYTEEHQFYERLEGITDYTRGYLEALMNAQQQVYGCNFIQESLTPKIIDDIYRILPMNPNTDGVESREYFYAQYVINRKITAIERQTMLGAIGAQYPVDVYTTDQNLNLQGVTRHNPIDYYLHFPAIVQNSKINLNITLRSIKSGIPLRAFDIMGAGGFLLTNYQADFLSHFVPNEDFVYFESKQDLLDKISYYLMHEKERLAIAQNGYTKVKYNHTYIHRILEFETVL
ncbi:DUF3880 domain-containing protein [Lachnospiraceae bacterium OttesenSCG-928-D06]|nr:DUF3880 domain-containing protein [Lachnospiraceae bacterium OttesenSCG-928-D06]